MKLTFTGFFKVDDLVEFNKNDSILLLGVPIERIKATPKGSKKSPDAIRKQSLEFSGVSSNFDISTCSTDFYDLGNINTIKDKTSLQIIWNTVDKKNNKLLVIGGDHSITYDTLNSAPWDEKTALIWLDAHADLADEYPPGCFYSHGTGFTNLK